MFDVGNQSHNSNEIPEENTGNSTCVSFRSREDERHCEKLRMVARH